MYLIENTSGDILDTRPTYEEAVDRASAMLADDPELGTLEVFRSEHQATVTHGPGPDWDSVIVVLKPDEKLAALASMRREFHCDPDESAGYDLDDPKHPTFYERMSAVWDDREKV